MTGIGAPLGLVTGAGTIGCGVITVKAAQRMGHKFGRSFEKNDHSHRRDSESHDIYNGIFLQTNQASVDIDKSRIQELGSHSAQDPNLAGSSKPFFPPAPEVVSDQQTIMPPALEQKMVAGWGV